MKLEVCFLKSIEMLYNSFESSRRVLRKPDLNGFMPHDAIFENMAIDAAVSAAADPRCGVAKKNMDLTEFLISVYSPSSTLQMFIAY